MPGPGPLREGLAVRRALVCSLALLAACEEEVSIRHADSMLKIEPERIDLGDVGIGLAARAELALSNSGEASLAIKSAAPDAMLGAEFTVSGLPPSIAPGQKLFAELTFAPTSPGVREGKLIFETDSAITPRVEVLVTARGVAPALVANPPV